MLISMNWVNDFVDLSGLDLEKLIHQFTLSTAEVEDVYHMGGDIENVVVARILSVENHPDSKKLHLLKVDAGDKIYDCVCGAPNVREGMTVAFAREGGKVGGTAITCAKIAGVESHGMCCSEKELGHQRRPQRPVGDHRRPAAGHAGHRGVRDPRRRL